MWGFIKLKPLKKMKNCFILILWLPFYSTYKEKAKNSDDKLRRLHFITQTENLKHDTLSLVHCMSITFEIDMHSIGNMAGQLYYAGVGSRIRPYRR